MLRTHACSHVCTHAHAHAHIAARGHVHMCTRMYTRTRCAYARISLHARTYVYVCIRMYTRVVHTYAFVRVCTPHVRARTRAVHITTCAQCTRVYFVSAWGSRTNRVLIENVGVPALFGLRQQLCCKAHCRTAGPPQGLEEPDWPLSCWVPEFGPMLSSNATKTP